MRMERRGVGIVKKALIGLVNFPPRVCAIRLRQRWLLSEERKAIEKAKKEGKQLEVAQIENEYSFYYQEYEEELELINTRRLVSKAYSLRLPVPRNSWKEDEDPNWQKCYFETGWFLKLPAFTELRDAVRKELMARHEVRWASIKAWATLITAMTGLLGAAAGLVAVLSRR